MTRPACIQLFVCAVGCAGDATDKPTTDSATHTVDTATEAGDSGGAGSDTGSDTGSDIGSDTGIDDPYIEGRACPPDSPLTWENFGEALMLTQCIGCHSDQLAEGAARGSAPVGVDFNSHVQTQAWLLRIYARSADDNSTMPPVDTISPEMRVQLGDWLACGAP